MENIQETYVGDNFLISWPQNLYHADFNAGKNFVKNISTFDNRKVPIFIFRKENINDFNPNVNILVDLIGNITLKEYIDKSVEFYSRLKWKIESVEYYENNTVGIISVINPEINYGLFQFQKVSISKGKAYVVSASIPFDKELSLNAMVIEELRIIVDSFRFII